jgi:predicted dehydrogenase
LKTVASTGGLSSHYAGKKFGFEEGTTAVDDVFDDDEVNTVIIATRHNTHAEFVCRALEAGKHVFVEKPLSIDREGLKRIDETYESVADRHGTTPLLMVGFNRRFAPHIEKVRTLLENQAEPPTFVMTVNAGNIPEDHWTQDPNVGGGRIIGEGCHFIDLLRDLADSPIDRVQAQKMGSHPAVSVRSDKTTINLGFENGAFGSVHYLANGAQSFPKERLEIFCGGGLLQLDNFRKLHGFDWPGFSSDKAWSQDKGNEACIQAFVEAIDKGSSSPIPYTELVEVTEATFQAVERA